MCKTVWDAKYKRVEKQFLCYIFLLPESFLPLNDRVLPLPIFLENQSTIQICQSSIVMPQAGTQTPGQSAAIPAVQSKFSTSSTHFSPCRHWMPDRVPQIRFSSAGGLVLATQIPPQSRPPFLGSQVSRGSSTQISVPSFAPAHWMFAMPPQKTGSGQKPVCWMEKPGRAEHRWP